MQGTSDDVKLMLDELTVDGFTGSVSVKLEEGLITLIKKNQTIRPSQSTQKVAGKE